MNITVDKILLLESLLHCGFLCFGSDFDTRIEFFCLGFRVFCLMDDKNLFVLFAKWRINGNC